MSSDVSVHDDILLYAYFEFAKYAQIGTEGLKRLPDMSFETFEEWAAEFCRGLILELGMHDIGCLRPLAELKLSF